MGFFCFVLSLKEQVEKDTVMKFLNKETTMSSFVGHVQDVFKSSSHGKEKQTTSCNTNSTKLIKDRIFVVFFLALHENPQQNYFPKGMLLTYPVMVTDAFTVQFWVAFIGLFYIGCCFPSTVGVLHIPWEHLANES